MTSVNDPHDLQRFVDAQSAVYERVCAELRNGRKRTHWMWFIFPQIHGLGQSPMAIKFAISSRGEAEAYLIHAVLGPRLIQCSQLVVAIQDRSINQIFGTPDDLKFRSSMTLFASVTCGHQIFQEALQKYFAGEPDQLTLDRL
jgi:uncharacterized protein (DUF1810 family)